MLAAIVAIGLASQHALASSSVQNKNKYTPPETWRGIEVRKEKEKHNADLPVTPSPHKDSKKKSFIPRDAILTFFSKGSKVGVIGSGFSHPKICDEFIGNLLIHFKVLKHVKIKNFNVI